MDIDLNSRTAIAHIDKVNALLPGATPEGAYALGLISMMVFRHGVLIPDLTIDAALACTSIREAVDLAKAVWEFRER